MKKALKSALLGMALFWVSGAAYANAAEDLHERSLEQYYSQNFSGWKGIVFVCSYNESDDILKRICDKTKTDIELLAARNAIPLYVANPNDFEDVWRASSSHDFLVLSYDLTSSTNNGDPSLKAVHARLAYNIYYSNAVEKGAKPGTLDSRPRQGALVIWEASQTGSGPGPNLIGPITKGIESFLKNAMTIFMKYR